MLVRLEDDNFACLGHKKNLPFADRVASQNQKKREDLGFEDKNILLIHVVTQDVLFNDEASTITYFKDITFGILYE